MKTRNVSAKVAARLAGISHYAGHLMACFNDAERCFRLLNEEAARMEHVIGRNTCELCRRPNPYRGEYKNVHVYLFEETIRELRKSCCAYRRLAETFNRSVTFLDKIAEIESFIKLLEIQNKMEE